MAEPIWGWPLPTARAEFELVATRELPVAHNPFRCAHHERVEALVAALPAEYYDPLWGWTASGERVRSTRERFDRELGEDELERCRYHRPHWEQIAAVACAFYEDRGAEWSYDELERRGRNAGLDEQDSGALVSLFGDPIHWGIGAEELTNGQHRGCALRHSGAPRCPVTRR